MQVSSNGRTWRTVAVVHGRGGRVLDSLTIRPFTARFIRIRVTAASAKKLPMLQELTVAS